MGVKLTQEEVIRRFREKHKDRYSYDNVVFVRTNEKVMITCKIHGDFPQIVNDHFNGKGCPECNRGGLIQTDKDEVIRKFVGVHGDKYDYSEIKYNGAHSKIMIFCKVKGHGFFPQSPTSHMSGVGCPYCSGISTSDDNRLSIKRPDLLKYLVNIDDGHNLSVSSNKKIYLKCPDCGKPTRNQVAVDKLSRRGFSCAYCNDRISIPEKFCMNILMQLGIDFEPQKIFDWAKDKRYDIYLEKYGVVAEIHGMQHYRETNRGRTLEHEISNDLTKKKLAIENGINENKYITIDCRYSEFEYLRENNIKALSQILCLDNIDWSLVWENSQASLLAKACDMWKNKDTNQCSVSSISKQFKVCKNTVLSWLNKGAKLGLCDYNGKINHKNILSDMHSIKVYQYDMDMNLIKIWKSATEIEKELGFPDSTIKQHSSGKVKKKSYKGYIWLNEMPYTEETEQTLIV